LKRYSCNCVISENFSHFITIKALKSAWREKPSGPELPELTSSGNSDKSRDFIEKIIVYKAEKVDGVRTQRIRIIYNCIGAIDFPKMDEKTA
jgi:hypothetical protein